MRMQNRTIFCLNLLLCAGIAAVWVLTPAWRRRPATAATSVKLPEAAPVAAVPAEAQAPHSMDGEAQALKGEIKSLRAEASQEVGALQEEYREFAERRREQVDETAEELVVPLDKVTDYPEAVLPKILYENLWRDVLKEAEKRIMARRIILDALSKSTLPDEDYQRIREYFSRLDEFDGTLEFRNYSWEELPPPMDSQTRQQIAKALEERQKPVSWSELSANLQFDGIGDFVVLAEDYAKIMAPVIGEPQR